MPMLTVTSGPAAGQQLEFHRSIVVGRGPLADLSIADPMISRRHALLTWDNEHCFISDLDSNNGTFLNREPVTNATEVFEGDEIHFATTTARFGGTCGSQPAAEAPSVAEPDSAASRQTRFLKAMGKTLQRNFRVESLVGTILEQILELVPAAERVILVDWLDSSQAMRPRAARTREREIDAALGDPEFVRSVIEKRQGGLLPERPGTAAVAPGPNPTTRPAAICVPVLFEDRALGAIQVDHTDNGRSFGEDDLLLLTEIASQAGFFLAYAELHGQLLQRQLIERDLQLAREIQTQFLPQSPPRLRGYAFAVDYSPALAIGGDFYDFPPLARGFTGIALGDVSGKGVSAALYVARLSSEVRVHAASEHEPGEILRRINGGLCGSSSSGMFVTMTICTLEPSSGDLVIASAGHPGGLLRAADGTVTLIGPDVGPPLGVSPEASFAEARYTVAPGDVVVWWTDGIHEAVNRHGDLFGEQRLREAISTAAPEAQEVLETVLRRVKDFAGTTPQADDITMLCLERRDPASERG